jgi:hypothetical protein
MGKAESETTLQVETRTVSEATINKENNPAFTRAKIISLRPKVPVYLDLSLEVQKAEFGGQGQPLPLGRMVGSIRRKGCNYAFSNNECLLFNLYEPDQSFFGEAKQLVAGAHKKPWQPYDVFRTFDDYARDIENQTTVWQENIVANDPDNQLIIDFIGKTIEKRMMKINHGPNKHPQNSVYSRNLFVKKSGYKVKFRKYAATIALARIISDPELKEQILKEAKDASKQRASKTVISEIVPHIVQTAQDAQLIDEQQRMQLLKCLLERTEFNYNRQNISRKESQNDIKISFQNAYDYSKIFMDELPVLREKEIHDSSGPTTYQVSYP